MDTEIFFLSKREIEVRERKCIFGREENNENELMEGKQLCTDVFHHHPL